MNPIFVAFILVIIIMVTNNYKVKNINVYLPFKHWPVRIRYLWMYWYAFISFDASMKGWEPK